ncbi:acyl-CoA dehydrogenase C-terminal domain-containing protein [Parvularcula dongshanensis]|uniref:3-methylmercaptopropionyl-CoA dehydrogenase n=1 Tax=Parvularcula dongshanensis TaxID=1173995 RepID=A0A840I209_9PROT|nr:acyl-CoA dehydrogenase C-terminal domain-containing protein [Parvularcula dongshanensis]MBB4658228.1 alkylation response protein AidB-like acyl-CoA dehydrogenase [Parvularcula dongshanensis]
MPVYDAPIRDMQFLLHDVLKLQNFSNLEGFADASPDVIDAFLEEAGRWHRDVIAPLNRTGDMEGCKRAEDGSVTTPKGFKEAYKQFCENGFISIAMDPDYGGQGLPLVLAYAINEMTSSANQAFGMYPGLSSGAYHAIHQNASDEQKQKYLPKMVTGKWSGTMNLTEPQCGTDLGLIRTKAVPQGDGSYKISGQKIWISAGEHDMADNIIHLVLARIEGAPEGIKGISLFIVPKFMVEEDGSLGERNGVSCGGLEEKMGIHGNATCVMNYDEATGFLVGEEHKGMRAMFVMMNEARLGVGLQGMAQAEVAMQNAAAFARDRLQSRSVTGAKAPDLPADPIIVHPDVRRMLMDTRAFVEGARALTYWTALQADLLHKGEDEKTRQKAGDYMALLTPVIKAYQTHKGYQGTNDAMQVFGGSGYVEEWGMSQFVRDCRIAMIYEGTNGIQALDLVGRKLMAEGGRYWQTFFAELDEWCADNKGVSEELDGHIEKLLEAKGELLEATQWLGMNAMANFDHAGAASHDYLHLFGLVALAYMWALMAKEAEDRKGEDDPFYKNKLVTARYFFERVLPETSAHLAKVKTGSDAMMALPAEAF